MSEDSQSLRIIQDYCPAESPHHGEIGANRCEPTASCAEAIGHHERVPSPPEVLPELAPKILWSVMFEASHRNPPARRAFDAPLSDRIGICVKIYRGVFLAEYEE
jgi:hypothetical protein